MTPAFMPGLALSKAFYDQVLAPQLLAVPHSAGLIGWGSDVLGYDTERSTDHGWGPRVLLFTDDGLLPELHLPETFLGWPVTFGWDAVVPRHHVTAHRPVDWLVERLGVDPAEALSTTDWLMMPWQRLLEVTTGAVFHDGLGCLERVRRGLRWFLDDVFRYVIASQWHRLAQEEAFVGRTREVGDDEGSRLVDARLRSELMKLALLLSRHYPPYAKWLGTAFRDLGVELSEGPHAFQAVAELHNRTGLTPSLDTSLRDYHSRPFPVLMCDRFADATRDTIRDPRLRAFPLIGSIDQVCSSVDVLNDNGMTFALRDLYQALGD